MSTPLELVSGLGGAIGSDFRQAQNQLLFVEYSGKLSRLNLHRTGSIVSSGSGTLRGTWMADFDTGSLTTLGANADVWWEQHTAVVRTMEARNGATQVNLGVVNFNSITPDTLASLAYSTDSIVGNNDASNDLVNGDVFAVRTNAGNYAKVKVITYGYDLQIQWVTYRLSSPYAVLGTGYSEPEDVQASSDGAHAYVTERSGDLVKVALTSADRSAATVVASGMTAPQQIFLDETNDAAYVVEYAPSGNLWHIDLSTGTKTALLSGLENAVGLILSADLQSAYISQQTAGADAGTISRFQLSDGARQTIVTGLTAPFFLQWLDAGETTLLVPERDPANRITAVNVAAQAANVAAPAVSHRPSSVALCMPSQMLVCCDGVIELVDLAPTFQPTGPVLMGIGFVPFDRIIGGFADTSADPTYFYQVQQAPFGGTLPLMINHMRVYGDGARYYRVRVNGAIRSDQWTDYRWNGATYIATNNATTSVGGGSGYYRVRPTGELFLWMNPALGDLLDTSSFPDGPNTITLEFINSAGLPIPSLGASLMIHVDNNPCTATVQTPTVHGNTADPHCGMLHYVTKDATPVVMPFTASHPNGFATFSFSLIKGINPMPLPGATTSGPVSAVSSPITGTVEELMEKCDTAGFAETVYVWGTAITGWGRVGYDASAALAFVLAP